MELGFKKSSSEDKSRLGKKTFSQLISVMLRISSSECSVVDCERNHDERNGIVLGSAKIVD